MLRHRWLISSCLALLLLAACGDGDGDGDAGGGGDGGTADGGADSAPGDGGGVDSTTGDGGGDGGVDARYEVSTCAFAGDTGDCDPIPLPDGPKTRFELAFALINPNTGPGCAGNLDLSLNGMGSGPGRMAWSAHELDSMTCMEVGVPIEGSRDLAPMLTEDVYLPNGDFTFRMQVVRQ